MRPKVATLCPNKKGNLNPEFIKSVKKLSSPTQTLLLALLSGVMLTASFPPCNLSFLAWVSLVPLLKGVDGQSYGKAFKLGFIAGIIHFVSLIYWIVVVLGHYGGLNLFTSISILILLCLYLSLYPALFSLMAASIKDSRFYLLWLASGWTTLEYVRAKILTGFPWCLLGYSQFEWLGLIQIADLCGVYGLSFLIALINGLIYQLLFRHRQKRAYSKLLETFAVLLLLGITIAYGQYRLSGQHGAKDSRQCFNTAIVQGNIDQWIKWDPPYQAKIMATYQRLTRNTRDFNPKLIVWPETSVPFYYQSGTPLSEMVISIADESGASLIFGSPAYRKTPDEIKYYNRAYLYSSKNHSLQYYDKVHLVPFGEYVPLKNFLTFVNRLVPAAGDFEAGDRIVPLNYEGLSIGILICFEAVFPELARTHAMKGANLLVNITNDAWFGLTSAPYQHLSMAVFRTIENGIPMLRAANTGFSAIIDSRGRIIKQGGLFKEEVLKAGIDLSGIDLTFYSRFGYLFTPLILILFLIKTLMIAARYWTITRMWPFITRST